MQEIKTVEMHTGGEPLRIVVAGYPEVKGHTLLEKRRYVKNHLDVWRKRLMLEPRGHSDMYGALIVTPNHPDADIAVLFLHNEGYSTMCGHGVIALGRYIVDNKLNQSKPIPVPDSLTKMNVPVVIQCPCGIVRAFVDVENGKSESVSFISVPGFSLCNDFSLITPSFGEVIIDVAYGGAFYALVNVNQLGLSLETTPVANLTAAADEISKSVRSSGLDINHPDVVDDEKDLSFLYGTILTDDQNQVLSRNLCVFADREVDRSPCGSGVTAQIIVQYAKGLIKQGQMKKFQNAKTKSIFTGEVAEEVLNYSSSKYDMVRVKVTGKAHYTGKAKFIFENEDPLVDGFRLQ